MTEPNLARLRRAVENWNRLGSASIVAVLDRDVEFVDLPHATHPAPRRGRDEIERWIGDMEEIWEDLRVELEEVIEVDEHRLIAVTRFGARAKGSGIEVDQPVSNLFTVRDGKCVRWEAYTSKEEALSAVGLGDPG